jgi:CheY-like chemotaxis protein
MKHPRPILLAEDNPNDVELILAAFKDANFVNEIHVTNDGEEVLDFLHRRARYAARSGPQPAVILLDLKMPKIDGREVLRHVRTHPDLRHIPVVILTSSREESDLLASYQLGANAFVVKPVDFQEFIAAVSKLGFFWAMLNEPPPADSTPPH